MSQTCTSGQKCKISTMVWAGDPAIDDTTNTMQLFYSNDGISYVCVKNGAICKNYYSTIPPKVPGTYINTVSLGLVIEARYFRFKPIEPNPAIKPGASNLRIDLKGCMQEWATEKGFTDKLEDLALDELDEKLRLFYAEVRTIPALDIVFLLSATSTNGGDAATAFTFMKNTVKDFVTLYGITYVKYGMIVFGNTVTTTFSLTTLHASKSALQTVIIGGATIISGGPDLVSALGTARTMIQGQSRANAIKVVVVMMDKSSSQTQAQCSQAASALRAINTLIIGIGIGNQIPIRQLDWITLNRYYVTMFPWGGNVRHLCRGIAYRCFKEFDITFAIGAASANKGQYYTLMKNTMGAICTKYGIKTIHYSFVTYGLGSASIVRSFTYTINNYASSASMKAAIDALTLSAGSGSFALDTSLQRCKTGFGDAKVRRSADRVVVLMTDKASGASSSTLKSVADSLGFSGIRIISVGIGTEVSRQELLTISSNEHDVIQVGSSETATQLETRIMYSTYRLYMINYDITFTINAVSLQANNYFLYMQNTIRSIMQKYGYGRCQYTFIVYGASAVRYYTYDHVFPNLEMLLRAFSRIPKVTTGTGLVDALNKAKSNFQTNSRVDAWKVLVFMSDAKLGLNEATLRPFFRSLEDIGVILIPVGMGRLINPLEYYYMSTYRDTVMFAADYSFTSYLRIGETIMNTMMRYWYIDLTFIINANSADFATTFTLMKNCMLKMIGKFGVYRFHYSVIIYGTSATKHFDFGTTFPYRQALISIVSGFTRKTGSSGIISALNMANTIYGLSSVRSNSIRGLAVIIDKPTGQTIVNLQNAAKLLHDKGVIVASAGVVGEAPYNELRALTISRNNVIRVTTSYSASMLADFAIKTMRKDSADKVDMVFAVSPSDDLSQTTTLMRNTIYQMIYRYGIYRFRYSIINFGNGRSVTFDFGSNMSDRQTIFNAVKNLKRVDLSKTTNIQAVFDEAKRIFQTKPTRDEARKAFVIVTDKPTSSSPSDIAKARRSLEDIGVTTIAVGVGDKVLLNDLRQYTVFKKNVIFKPTISYDITENIVKRITRVPEIDMVFTMTDGTTSSNTVQQLMPNIIKALSDKYGPVKIRFSVVNVGSTPKIEFDYNTVALPDKESVRKQVTKLAPIAGAPDIKKALVEVEKIFNASASTPRPNARRINLIVTDKKFGVPMAELEKAVEPLERIGVQQIAVSIGDKPNTWELKKMTRSDSKILQVSESTSPTEIGDNVMRVIMNDDLDDQVLTFAVSASTPENLAFVKEVIKNIIRRVGLDDIAKINVIPFGSTASSPISFDADKYPDVEALLKAIDAMIVPAGSPSIVKLLEEVMKIYSDSEIPEEAKKNLVVMSDKQSTDTPEDIAKKVKAAKDSGININSVPLSSDAAKDNELISGEKEAAVNVKPASDNPVGSAEEIMAEVAASKELDLLGIGCGALLDNDLLKITSTSFSASSGTPGLPLLSGQPWKPTTLNSAQNLTVDADPESDNNNDEIDQDVNLRVRGAEWLHFRPDGEFRLKNALSILDDECSGSSDEESSTTDSCGSGMQAFKARKMLAAIDHNYHINRKSLVHEKGEVQVTRKYISRTKRWDAQVIKEDKDYAYIPQMLAMIFERRKNDPGTMNDYMEMAPDDPRRIIQHYCCSPPIFIKITFCCSSE
ncbi:hypothetical protein QZH41_001981 [Actinostola sp. cb2023]|nr:hypothetical protein QZH41_001981 [Actinostola sp. cb2023]